MKDKDYITIYWTASPFTEVDDQWNFLYQDPVSVISDLNKNRNKDVQLLFSCPAYVNSMKNIYAFKNVFADKIIIDDEFHAEKQLPYYYLNKSKLQVMETRTSSIDKHINIVYNMGWLLFADEPVEARFTAPYFPPVTPANGVMLAPGQFNIGLWYREYLLDYHVPITTKELIFEEDQPLFYVEIKTEKKIIFKRYKNTFELNKIRKECVTSPQNYEASKPLSRRYDIFKKTASPERVLSYIKNNLI